jgi:DNA-binding PucR family transcriptional regulator
MTAGAARPRGGTDLALREHLSKLQGLLALSMLMAESDDEDRILQLATTAVPSLGPGRLLGAYVDGEWSVTAGACEQPEVRADIEAQFAVISSAGGAIAILLEAWGWAYPLRSLDEHSGYLVVGAGLEPRPDEQFLLRALAQQAGITLANARLHARHLVVAEDLRSANVSLARSVAVLERKTAIHDSLTRASVAGGGREAIARAIHELTGYPVAVEDRHGNLRAWVGPDCPDPYPKASPRQREELLARAQSAGSSIRADGRLIAIANPRDDLIGVLAIIDPDDRAGAEEHVALEHGATLLAVELVRLHSLAETELRIGRDLIDELLDGGNTDGALRRAQALGYDIERRHRVIVAERSGASGAGASSDRDELFHAVRRAARDTLVGSLLGLRQGRVVVLCDAERAWEEFRANVVSQLKDGSSCRIGVGGVCHRPDEFPRSYREATLALRMLDTTRGADQASVFDDLGVYRILADVKETAGVERFVREWLGALLDYDATKGSSDLVATLTQYLEAGGNYAATAAAIAVHRSTLKYRLHRIREISGHDLGDPDTAFNLQLATRAWQTLQALRSEPS